MLPKQLDSFDFSKDESLVLDRSELDWPATEKDIDELYELHKKTNRCSFVAV